MKVIIEGQMYDARNVFEINVETSYETMLQWMPEVAEDTSDETIRRYFESLGYAVLEV